MTDFRVGLLFSGQYGLLESEVRIYHLFFYFFELFYLSNSFSLHHSPPHLPVRFYLLFFFLFFTICSFFLIFFFFIFSTSLRSSSPSLFSSPSSSTISSSSFARAVLNQVFFHLHKELVFLFNSSIIASFQQFHLCPITSLPSSKYFLNVLIVI